MAQCCNCLLRTLTFIIGLLAMAGSIGGLVYLFLYLETGHPFMLLRNGSAMALAVNFILSTLMAIGAGKNRSSWAVPWLYFVICGLIVICSFIIMHPTSNLYIALSVSSLVWSIVFVYTAQELCGKERSKEAAII